MSMPKAVPFVGWSLAAMNFRQQMRQRAAAGVSLLLVGEPGTGKKEMAEAWRQASGVGKVPIIDLDEPTATIPERCIAITTRPVRTKYKELQPLDLTNLRPVSDCRLHGKKIPDRILSQFAKKFLIPPLRQRQMDLLAAVYCQGSQLPIGSQPVYIGSQLIYRMFLDAAWMGNLRTLDDHMHMAFLAAKRRAEELAAAQQKEDPSAMKKPGDPPEVTIREDDLAVRGAIDANESVVHQLLPAIRPSSRARSLGMKHKLWTCDDVNVPIRRLPLVAVAIFFDAFGKMFEEEDEDPSATYVLGDPWLWIDPDGLLESRFGKFTVSALGSIEPPKFLQRWNLGAESDQADITRLTTFHVYGASLTSLQDGFREMSMPPQAEASKQRSAKPSRRRKGEPTEEQVEKYLKVIELKLRGLRFWQIADEMGMNSRQVAHKLYKLAVEYLAKHKPDPD